MIKWSFAGENASLTRTEPNPTVFSSEEDRFLGKWPTLPAQFHCAEEMARAWQQNLHFGSKGNYIIGNDWFAQSPFWLLFPTTKWRWNGCSFFWQNCVKHSIGVGVACPVHPSGNKQLTSTIYISKALPGPGVWAKGSIVEALLSLPSYFFISVACCHQNSGDLFDVIAGCKYAKNNKQKNANFLGRLCCRSMAFFMHNSPEILLARFRLSVLQEENWIWFLLNFATCVNQYQEWMELSWRKKESKKGSNFEVPYKL